MSANETSKDCGCNVARRDLEEYLRNEICQGNQEDIRAHLTHCTSCQDEERAARTLTEAVSRACREEVAPEDLRDRVLARLRELQAEHEPPVHVSLAANHDSENRSSG